MCDRRCVLVLLVGLLVAAALGEDLERPVDLLQQLGLINARLEKIESRLDSDLNGENRAADHDLIDLIVSKGKASSAEPILASKVISVRITRGDQNPVPGKRSGWSRPSLRLVVVITSRFKRLFSLEGELMHESSFDRDVEQSVIAFEEDQLAIGLESGEIEIHSIAAWSRNNQVHVSIQLETFIESDYGVPITCMQLYQPHLSQLVVGYTDGVIRVISKDGTVQQTIETTGDRIVDVNLSRSRQVTFVTNRRLGSFFLPSGRITPQTCDIDSMLQSDDEIVSIAPSLYYPSILYLGTTLGHILTVRQHRDRPCDVDVFSPISTTDPIRLLSIKGYLLAGMSSGLIVFNVTQQSLYNKEHPKILMRYDIEGAGACKQFSVNVDKNGYIDVGFGMNDCVKTYQVNILYGLPLTNPLESSFSLSRTPIFVIAMFCLVAYQVAKKVNRDGTEKSGLNLADQSMIESFISSQKQQDRRFRYLESPHDSPPQSVSPDAGIGTGMGLRRRQSHLRQRLEGEPDDFDFSDKSE